jgi:glycerophosphoryl diester phosphodiesterase
MRPRRVGHKGAAHLAQGNTPASFDAALAQRVDMIEFDVLSERIDGSGELLVAHDYEDMSSRTPLTLAQALAYLAGEEFAGIEFDLDVKLPGYELRVVDALREAGLTSRTLLSGMFPDSLARVRAMEPALRLGWSVPRVRRDYTNDMLMKIPALGGAHIAVGGGRRDHGPLAGRHARAGARGRGRGRGAVCVDGR